MLTKSTLMISYDTRLLMSYKSLCPSPSLHTACKDIHCRPKQNPTRGTGRVSNQRQQSIAGLAALLETKEAAWSNGIRPDPSQIHQPLLVCTAHIHWDPQYCDVKLVQTMMLMHEVYAVPIVPSSLSWTPFFLDFPWF